MRKFLGVVLGMGFACLSYSQEFGGTPSSVKWKQINTDTARIIFQQGRDSSAQRVAAIIHRLAATQPLSLGKQLKKINIVLQSQTNVPNGYVGLGPFRSEFYMTPEPNNLSQGTLPWVDQLSIHEYRHVQQFNNFNNGLSRFMKAISGEDGYSLAINAAIPDWFYEGDAVYNETALSKQGRGRLPHFMNAYPSLWLANKHYSWMKLRNGSLKDFVPNHYFLGYLLVNYGREKYGTDIWTKITRDASAYKGFIYPFQAAVKKYTGLEYKEFVKQALDSYRNVLSKENPLDGELVFPVDKHYIHNYYFPYAAGKDSLVYQKSTYRQRPAFYLRDKKGEHLIRYRDISLDEQFSYRNGKIVYVAYETDARWGWKDYTVIKLLDIQRKEERSIGSGTRYATPDLSPSGLLVAAVKNSENGSNQIDILDANDGSLKYYIHTEGVGMLTDPKFIDENNLVMVARMKDGRTCLVQGNIINGSTQRLTDPGFGVMGYPSVNGNLVFFTASWSGNDEIYSYDLQTKKIFCYTQGELGNYFVNASGNELTWSRFTAEGYLLMRSGMDALKPVEVKMVGAAVKFPVAHSKELPDILGKETVNDRPISNYSKSTRLFNFHSYRPYYSDPLFTYSIYGENVLNTLQTEIYYSYNQNEKTNAVGLSEWYGALFPYLNLGIEYTFDRETVIGNRLRQWGQLDSRIGLQLPLQSTKGRNFKNFSLGTFYVLRNEFNKGFYRDSLGNTSFSYLLHTISWSQQVQRAVQHSFPRLGYLLNAQQRYAISSVEGYQFIGNGTIYLPGIMRNHNLILTGAFQQRDTLSQLSFSDRFSYSRGYTGRYFSRMWRGSVNYHFPLWYPDWGFGNILYLQVIRVNGFYDFTKIYSRDKKTTRDQRSLGGELFIDTRWWNQYPLTFGFRISKLLDKDQLDGRQGTRFEFVLPVSIIPR